MFLDLPLDCLLNLYRPIFYIRVFPYKRSWIFALHDKVFLLLDYIIASVESIRFVRGLVLSFKLRLERDFDTFKGSPTVLYTPLSLISASLSITKHKFKDEFKKNPIPSYEKPKHILNEIYQEHYNFSIFIPNKIIFQNIGGTFYIALKLLIKYLYLDPTNNNNNNNNNNEKDQATYE
ncbi:hypothetical protein H8356DRAFT_1335883 [Neocallimastix lanati (nom. inval.)]|nr:hypothetical protein H8356DRAFT_1335883 [Neocallimastix sp. JGI-2020a]